MIIPPYKERVEYLRSRTDSVNRCLGKAFVPEFIDGVTTQPVTTHVFEDDYVLSSSASVRIFQTESILFNNMPDRQRSVIDNTITLQGKVNETFNDISAITSIPVAALMAVNRDKFPSDITVDANTSVYGVVIDTTLEATLPNLIKLGIIRPFMCFLDGLYVPIEYTRMKTDLYNDYILLDISWMENRDTLIRDYTRLDMLQYRYLSPVPTEHKIFTFDGNGSITSAPTSEGDMRRFHVYSNDPLVFSKEMFVDPETHRGTYGTMFFERVEGLHYKNKVKPNCVYCFQNGRLIRDAEVDCRNFNIISVRYQEFDEDSRAMVVVSKRVEYTEDNTLRLAHSVVETLGSAFEDFLDDTELSCQTFIDEIYRMAARSDKYGFQFHNVHIDNAEEYPTPWDEIITYTNEDTKKALYHLISEIFEKDVQEVRDVMKGIVDEAYQEEYDGLINNDEWILRKNLPEMFSHEEKEDPRFFHGMGGINDSFDFVFYDTKSYEENFLAAIAYIANYDSDKLECGLPRFEFSAVTTGEAIQSFINTEGALEMVCGPANHRENYVMIFVNGELYANADKITYHDRYFKVPNFICANEDKIEIVFYLYCNNTIMPLKINDSVVTCKYLYDKPEVQLWSDITPEGRVDHQDQVYQVPFTITDPWVRGHGVTPLPSGGGVEFINGPVIHFDDSDIGYDAFVNITTPAGLAAVEGMIDTYISDSEINAILHDAATAAYETDFPKSTVVASYASLPTDPTNGMIIFFVGDDYMSFKHGRHYQYNSASATWVEYFSLSDQSNMYSELSLRSHLSDTFSVQDTDVDKIQELMDAIYQYSLEEEGDDPPEEPDPEPTTDWYLIPDPEMYKLELTPSDLLFWDNANGWTTSRRQFRHQRTTIEILGARTVSLNETFKFCTNPRQYMVFVNQRCLPRSYVVIAPSVGVNKPINVEVMLTTPTADMVGKTYHYLGDDADGFLQNHYYLAKENTETHEYYWVEADYHGSNPVGHITFYSNITLAIGDVVDIYYVPDEMNVDFNESVIKRTPETNSGYIKIDKTHTKTGISRNSSFVFVNGRKISYDDVKDISSDIVKVTDEYPNPASMELSLEVYRYLYTNEDYQLTEYAPSKLDDMVPEEPEVLDWLMDTNTEPSGDEEEVFPNRISKDAVKNAILLDFVSSDDDSWLAEF